MGQHIADHLPRSFSWSDIDGVIYRHGERILRVCEHKPLGGQLRPSQKTILPLLAVGIEDLVHRRMVSPFSGVFRVCTDDLEQGAEVTRIMPRQRLLLDKPVWLDGDDWLAFQLGVVCERIDVRSFDVPDRSDGSCARPLDNGQLRGGCAP
jgi:hypothetical protein